MVACRGDFFVVNSSSTSPSTTTELPENPSSNGLTRGEVCFPDSLSFSHQILQLLLLLLLSIATSQSQNHVDNTSHQIIAMVLHIGISPMQLLRRDFSSVRDELSMESPIDETFDLILQLATLLVSWT